MVSGPVEELVVEELRRHEDELGVRIVPGRSREQRPDSYIAVVSEAEDERGAGAGLVSLNVVCVAQIDDDGELEQSKTRIAWLWKFFSDPACPLRGKRDRGICIDGIYVEGSAPLRKERSVGDFLFLKVGAHRIAG